MTDNIDAVTNSWRDGQILDVHKELTTFTLRTLTETVFSDALPPSVFQQTVEDISTLLAGVYRRMILPPLFSRLPTRGNRHYHEATTRLHKAVRDVIRNRRASGEDSGDLLSILLAARDPDAEDTSAGGGRLTDTEVADQLVTFFVAGAESTATTVAWVMHLLANHPDIADRVHAEVDAVLAGAPASWEHLPKLKLTGRVVTEALRLYPPGWIVTRTVAADTSLGGHDLRAGTTVVYSPYLIHRRGDLYTDPERFDPDRWDEQHRPQPPRNAFIVFGGGARKCIGDEFGITEAVLSVATIAARWKLRGLPGQRVRPVASISLNPVGLRMRVTARAPQKVAPSLTEQHG